MTKTPCKVNTICLKLATKQERKVVFPPPFNPLQALPYFLPVEITGRTAFQHQHQPARHVPTCVQCHPDALPVHRHERKSIQDGRLVKRHGCLVIFTIEINTGQRQTHIFLRQTPFRPPFPYCPALSDICRSIRPCLCLLRKL